MGTKKPKKLTFSQFCKAYERDIVKIFIESFPGLKKENFKFDWNKRSFAIDSDYGSGDERMQMVLAVNNQMKLVKIPN